MSGICAYKRKSPPVHCCLEVKDFIKLYRTKVRKYETDPFEAGGYKWSLNLYPNGNNKRDATGYISLYLAIEEPKKLPRDRAVHATFRVFVHNQMNDTYLTSEGEVALNNEFTKWGVPKMISLEKFNLRSSGYLHSDTCKFGAEIFVRKSPTKSESLLMFKGSKNKNEKQIFKIPNFSKPITEPFHSCKFSIGNNNWKLKIYPKGHGNGSDKSLSIHLELLGAENLPPKRKIYGDFMLRVYHHPDKNPEKKRVTHWFCKSSFRQEYDGIMSKDRLRNLHKDVLTVEVEILMLSIARVHK